MGTSGGIAIQEILEKLRERLLDYFGALNEIKEGIRLEVPEKPVELGMYELIQSTGLPLVRGALIDQPHIWLRQWEVIHGIVELFDHLDGKKADE